MKKGILSVLIISLMLLAVSCMMNSNSVSSTTSLKTSAVPPVNYTAIDNGEAAETFEVKTDYFTVVFNTRGASVSSLLLNEHKNADGSLVDVIYKESSDNNAFLLYWQDDIYFPVKDVFAHHEYEENGSKYIVFTKDFLNEEGQKFTVTKTFEFKKSDYLFAVNVDITSDGIGDAPFAFTIGYEPQVGPNFAQKKGNNNRYDYRNFLLGFVKDNGKVKKQKPNINSGDWYLTTSDYKWVCLTSKYFAVIAVPENGDASYKYHMTLDTSNQESQKNSMFVSVNSEEAKGGSSVYFYCGPQLKDYLGSYYNRTKNEWGFSNLNLDDAMESGSALGWLENILKWVLNLLYKIIPNYGVGIILLTLILKAILWPFNKSSMSSTAKMSAIQPEIDEIKKKYPENVQKQNMELQGLYKKYGIKPLGGCLPLLIQFPILIAFYGLLNKHFELRGKPFFGWISDLSVAEVAAVLPFNIPLLGNEIHVLPIIYTVSMIFSMKMSQSKQSAGTDKNPTMWFMTWGMPIMFFFILYSAPSGLLLYWTVSNILSILQQIFINKNVMNKGVQEIKSAKEKKEPAAVLKYQEKLKKLEAEKNSKNKGNKK